MKYILKRLCFYLIAFFAAAALNFFLPRLMPGNPVQMYLAEMGKSGGKIDPAVIESVEQMFGYDESVPVIQSFFQYIVNIFRGDWGVSFAYYPQTVLSAVQHAMGWTVFLMGTSMIIGFIVNNLLGILVAWKRGSRLDTTLTVGGQIIANIPSAITALLLSFWLCYSGVFPLGYAVTPLYQPPTTWAFIKDVLYHAAVPLLAILATSLGGIMGMRANMINQLGDDYIVMGIAKGLPESKIMFGYGARNALLPVVTSLAMQIGFMLGGSLIVEQVFNYPGLGKIMVNAINRRDYPLMQGILLMTTILMLSANFLADIAVLLLDPRTRTQSTTGK